MYLTKNQMMRAKSLYHLLQKLQLIFKVSSQELTSDGGNLPCKACKKCKLQKTVASACNFKCANCILSLACIYVCIS